VLVLACQRLFSSGPIQAEHAPLFDADPSEVRLVWASMNDTDVTAQRSSPGVQFSVQHTHAQSRASQHCESSATLAGVLPQILGARLVGRVEATGDVRELGWLEVRDGVLGELPPPWRVLTSKADDRVLVEREGARFATDLRSSVLTALGQGCSKLVERH
jgi:hypothetical protein